MTKRNFLEPQSQRVVAGAAQGASQGALTGYASGGPAGALVGSLIGGLSGARLARPGESEQAYRQRLRQLELEALGLTPAEEASLRAKAVDPRLSAIREQQVQANAAGLSADIGAQARQMAVMREEARRAVGAGARDMADVELQMMRQKRQEVMDAQRGLMLMDEQIKQNAMDRTSEAALELALMQGEGRALSRLQRMDEQQLAPMGSNAIDLEALGVGAPVSGRQFNVSLFDQPAPPELPPGTDKEVVGMAGRVAEQPAAPSPTAPTIPPVDAVQESAFLVQHPELRLNYERLSPEAQRTVDTYFSIASFIPD